MHDTDCYSTNVRTDFTAGRGEYVGHVEYHHVYATHLLEKHASDADQQGPAVSLVGQHFRQRVILDLLLFDERLKQK